MSDESLLPDVDFGDWMESDYPLSSTGDDSYQPCFQTEEPHFEWPSNIDNSADSSPLSPDETRNNPGNNLWADARNDRADLSYSAVVCDVDQPMSISDTNIEYSLVRNVLSSSISESQSSKLAPNTKAELHYTCGHCGKSFYYDYQLKNHSRQTGHTPYRCVECREPFKFSEELNRHSQKTGHAGFECPSADCDATFSRHDSIVRHQPLHKENTIKYSCPHCKKWRAPNGFPRKDHLTQHLRNYHHVDSSAEVQSSAWLRLQDVSFFAYCPHEGCALFRDPKDHDGRLRVKEHLFRSRSAYTTHLRKEHNYSQFPCTIPGCNRVGGKGYFRKRDLMKHVAKAHPDAESQAAGPEEFEIDFGAFEE